jgi:hypothetical protein
MLFRSLALAATLAACSSPVLDTSTEDELIASAEAPSSAAPSTPSVQRVELGVVASDQPFAFDVPADALGFTIAATWPPNVTGNEHGIRTLVAPSRRLVVRELVSEGGTLPSTRVVRGVSTFAVPSTTATLGETVGGRWIAVVDGPQGATVTLRIQRGSAGRFQGGVLDLDVYLPDGLVTRDPEPARIVTANSATGDANVRARVDIFYRLLSEHVGIGRGTVRYHAIDRRYLSATTGDARAELLSAARGPHAGLAVVLTNELAYGEGASLLGYSVDLPGLLDAAGSPHGAIAVATNGKTATAENDALTLFHELGQVTSWACGTRPTTTARSICSTTRRRASRAKSAPTPPT